MIRAAAVAVQCSFRAHRDRIVKRVAERALLNRAVRVIQRCWRACECVVTAVIIYTCYLLLLSVDKALVMQDLGLKSGRSTTLIEYWLANGA